MLEYCVVDFGDAWTGQTRPRLSARWFTTSTTWSGAFARVLAEWHRVFGSRQITRKRYCGGRWNSGQEDADRMCLVVHRVPFL